MLVHHRVTPSSKFTGTHLYTWVERGTMRVKYLAQKHNAVPWPGLEPGPRDPESSALTIRPPCLPQGCALRKITRSPKVPNYEIQGAQHKAYMKEIRFSGRPKEKVSRLRHPGALRAWPCFNNQYMIPKTIC